MEPQKDKPVQPRKGLKILGIVLIVLAVITTLSALTSLSRMAAIEADASTQLGRRIGVFILPALLALGGWYSLKKAKGQ